MLPLLLMQLGNGKNRQKCIGAKGVYIYNNVGGPVCVFWKAV